MKRGIAFGLVYALISIGAATADVKYVQETQIKFTGALGTMMKFLGGSKPQTSTIMLKGNTLRTDGEESSQMIDLNRQAFADINHKKKEYIILTFAELKAQMEKARREAEEKMKEAKEKQNTEPSMKAKFNLSVNPTGKTETLEGHRAEEVIVSMTIEGQDTSGAQGGLVTTSDMWMAKDLKGYEEVENFYRRLAEKLGDEWMGGMAKMWETLSASDPELAESMKKLGEETRKMEGVPLLSTTSFDLVGSPANSEEKAEAKGEPKEESRPGKPSLGGLLGKFGKKKVEQKQKEKEAQKAAGGNRSNLMTATTKISGFSTVPLGSELFQIPAGYKEVKKKD